ncbi:hypothetical protein D3C86_1607130 [compost metagenome]
MVLNRNNWLDKLIRHIFIIRFLNRLYKIFTFFPNAVYHQVIRQLHALPTPVSVHRVVTTNQRSQFSCGCIHMCQKLFYETFSGFWVTISTVCESVNENIFVQSKLVSGGQ